MSMSMSGQYHQYHDGHARQRNRLVQQIVGNDGDGGNNTNKNMTEPPAMFTSQEPRRKLRFAMLSGGSTFFDPVREGWEETCERLSDEVECIYIPENWTYFLENHDPAVDLAPCVPQMRDLLDQVKNDDAFHLDGVSVQCGKDHPVFWEAKEAGIPIISFDVPFPSPSSSSVVVEGQEPESISTAYVGTDNYYLGSTLARLLRLLRPEGGTYHVVSFTRIPLRYQGFVDEIEKHNNRPIDEYPHWYKATTNLTGKPDGDDLEIGESLEGTNFSSYIELLDEVASLNPTAIVLMYQTPMRHPNYTDFVERNRWRNITIIGTQGSDDQLELMARRNVDGLTGQITFDMGRLSVETLYKIATNKEVPPVLFTKLANYNLVPEALPEATVDQSLLGSYRVAGFVCFGIVTVSAIFAICWTIYNRKGIVIQASQPFFLIMTAIGVLIMASAIIPMSFDDAGVVIDETYAVAICMTVPWLAFVGFSVIFSALFSKTWRINRIFHNRNSYERIKVSERDVLGPFTIILTLNITVLICWTVIDPLTYIREFEDGTDLCKLCICLCACV